MQESSPVDSAASPIDPDRVHHYTTTCSWTGSTGAGYAEYNRAHSASAPPSCIALAMSSDPAFRGDSALLNPEQLIVIAASSCQMLAFLAVAARARIDVVSYQDHAAGEMPENDLPVRITAIRLRPRIVIATPVAARPQATEERVRQLVELAHRECFIANSLKTEIRVEPTIEWA